MTILFAGGEMSAFAPSDSIPIEYVSSVITYDSAFSRCGLRSQGVSYMETAQFAAATECWTHALLYHNSGSATLTTYPLVWVDGSGVDSVRLKHVSGTSNTLALEYWNGAAWTAAGSAVAVQVNLDTQAIDFRILCNTASGNLSLYVAGTERINASVDLSGITSIRKFRALGDTAGGFNFDLRLSQVIIADEPTIGWRLATLYPSGTGADTAWTGAYTSIDETVYSDADFINSGSAAQVSTFALTGPAMTGYSVRAVVVTARARRGASGPQNIRMALRSSGTTYPSGSDIALGLGYAPVQAVWETDPATSSAWVNTAISTLQAGVKSIA